ncbi:hypothetical protein [Methylobacterium sp. JK268]
MRYSLLAGAFIAALSATVPAAAEDGRITVFPPLSRMMVRESRVERPASELTTVPQPVPAAPVQKAGQRFAEAR